MEDLDKMNFKTYVAPGAINIEHIEHVEHLYPGNPALLNLNKTKDNSEEELSVVGKFLKVIGELIANNIIQEKQEFAAIFRIVQERVLPEIKRGEFCRLVCENVPMAEDIKPSEDNIRKVVFSDSKTALYPNWKITGFSVEKTFRYTEIAKCFVEKMK